MLPNEKEKSKILWLQLRKVRKATFIQILFLTHFCKKINQKGTIFFFIKSPKTESSRLSEVLAPHRTDEKTVASAEPIVRVDGIEIEEKVMRAGRVARDERGRPVATDETHVQKRGQHHTCRRKENFISIDCTIEFTFD